MQKKHFIFNSVSKIINGNTHTEYSRVPLYKYIVSFKVPVRDCYEKGLEILLLRVHLKVLKL